MIEAPQVGRMRTQRRAVEHGAAIRVPPAHDAGGRQVLMTWLGAEGRPLGRGLVEVSTPIGAAVAAPGDWIVLAVDGSYHVTRSS
ncbi:MAG: hypothetical protein JO127_03505 [Caulobacteraceae bacterium]|nr:hypothetical protein [Caulobacteraceae bacterium]